MIGNLILVKYFNSSINYFTILHVGGSMNNSSFLLGEFVCFVNLKLWSHRLNYRRPRIGKYLFFFHKNQTCPSLFFVHLENSCKWLQTYVWPKRDRLTYSPTVNGLKLAKLRGPGHLHISKSLKHPSQAFTVWNNWKQNGDKTSN